MLVNKLSHYLKYCGYEVITNESYGHYNLNGKPIEDGEIDCIAFKDDEIRIYEVKSFSKMNGLKRANKQLKRGYKRLTECYGPKMKCLKFYVHPKADGDFSIEVIR